MLANETIFVVLYILAYSAVLILFTRYQTEPTHWVTLVAMPIGLLFWLQNGSADAWSLSKTFTSIGLRSDNLTSGLVPGVAVGLAMSVATVAVSGRREAVLAIFRSGRFAVLLPAALIATLLTAGTTEEIFFRGIVQPRLGLALGSETAAILVTAAIFGAYHVPFAYFLDAGTRGNLAGSIKHSAVFPAVLGLVAGTAYANYENLLVPIVIHTLSNSLWAMTELSRPKPALTLQQSHPVQDDQQGAALMTDDAEGQA